MQINSKLTLATAAITISLLAGCVKKEEQPAETAKLENPSKAHQPSPAHLLQIEEISKLYPTAKSTESGLHYIVEKTGAGETPSKGQIVTAHYQGTLLSGEVFDSSLKRNKPFSFPVGRGRVIKGWDEAFLSMKKGEKRKLILPADIAYGLRGSPPVIPANAILVFDVELVDFK